MPFRLRENLHLAFCLAEQTPDKLTTVLTFSKDLKQEARDKIKKLGLTNIRSVIIIHLLEIIIINVGQLILIILFVRIYL